MKVKVLKEFTDIKAGVTRHKGDVFECSKDRFDEIKEKLKSFCSCDWIEEVIDDGKSVEAVKAKTGNNGKPKR